MMKTRQENDVTDRTSIVYPKIKTKLYDLLDRMQPITKNRKDNNVINHTRVIFEEYNTKLSKPIR